MIVSACIFETLFYYDGPQIVAGMADRRRFIGVAAPNGVNGLFIEVEDADYARFKAREVDLLSLLREPKGNCWYFGESLLGTIELQSVYEHFNEIPEDLLPDAGLFLTQTPAEVAKARQPKLDEHQTMRLRNLLIGYMLARRLDGLCPYDSNTVGIANAFSESLPIFPHSVPDWPDNDKEAQKKMFDESLAALNRHSPAPRKDDSLVTVSG